MRVWTSETRRLDLRPETCPHVFRPQFQDPGYAGIWVIFLGLFDVTRSCAVAGVGRYGTVGTVWHCFDSMTLLY